MDDRDAFCVLVKLMEDYELRTMFTADMAGLQLRMYQFENLFAERLPRLVRAFHHAGRQQHLRIAVVPLLFCGNVPVRNACTHF